MKKLSILFIALIALAGCTKHETKMVDKLGCINKNSLNYDTEATIDDGSCIALGPKQYGFVLEYTATWCVNCGIWGTPTMHELIAMGDVIGIACHGDNDPMYNAGLYTSFSSARPDGGGIPSFWIGDESMPPTPSAYPGKMTTLMSRDPDASIICQGVRKDDSVTITAYSEFLKDLTGDYYVSVMITETGIDGSATSGAYKQEGTTTPDTYTHQHVLRAAYGNNCYGSLISSGSVIAGKMFQKNYTLYVDPTWTEQLATVVVLWKKNGMMYEYINAFENSIK